MSNYLLRLSKGVTGHYNFSLDANELKIRYKGNSNSSFGWIKDIVSITEDLNKVGINHVVYDKYIQVNKASNLHYFF